MQSINYHITNTMNLVYELAQVGLEPNTIQVLAENLPPDGVLFLINQAKQDKEDNKNRLGHFFLDQEAYETYKLMVSSGLENSTIYEIMAGGHLPKFAIDSVVEHIKNSAENSNAIPTTQTETVASSRTLNTNSDNASISSTYNNIQLDTVPISTDFSLEDLDLPEHKPETAKSLIPSGVPVTIVSYWMRNQPKTDEELELIASEIHSLLAQGAIPLQNTLNAMFSEDTDVKANIEYLKTNLSSFQNSQLSPKYVEGMTNGQFSHNQIKLHFALTKLRSFVHMANGEREKLNTILKSQGLSDVQIREINKIIDQPIGSFCPTMSPIKSDCDYMPLTELLSNMPVRDLTYLLSRSWSESDGDEKYLGKFRDKASAMNAHGIETCKGGLRNLANLMFEGVFRSSLYRGAIGGANDHNPQLFSGNHGPFFILLGTKDQRDFPVAFVVPSENDKVLLLNLVSKAEEIGMIDSEKADDMRKRIFTQQQLLTFDDTYLKDGNTLDSYIS